MKFVDKINYVIDVYFERLARTYIILTLSFLRCKINTKKLIHKVNVRQIRKKFLLLQQITKLSTLLAYTLYKYDTTFRRHRHRSWTRRL